MKGIDRVTMSRYFRVNITRLRSMGYFFQSKVLLTPKEVAHLSGVAQDVQRDWRRHGHLKGLGQQTTSGRWLYDYTDAFIIYLMRRLNLGGVDLKYACEFAAGIVGRVAVWSLADEERRLPDGRLMNTSRFCFVRYHADQDHGDSPRAHSMILIDDLHYVAGLSEVATLFDLKAIADGIPDKFRHLIGEVGKDVQRSLEEDRD